MPDDRLEPAQLALTVRSPRRLTFVPIVEDFDWRLSFAAALGRHCEVWGGVGHLLMPLDAGTEDHDLFWSVASLYDADTYAVADITAAELELLDPAFYEQRVQALLKQTNDPDLDRDVIETFLSSDAFIAGELDPPLVAKIISRLGPMCDLTSPDAGTASVGNAVDLRVSDLADLPPDIGQTSTTLGPDATLLLAAEFGLYQPSLTDELRERDVHLVPRAVESSEALEGS